MRAPSIEATARSKRHWRELFVLPDRQICRLLFFFVPKYHTGFYFRAPSTIEFHVRTIRLLPGFNLLEN